VVVTDSMRIVAQLERCSRTRRCTRPARPAEAELGAAVPDERRIAEPAACATTTRGWRTRSLVDARPPA
jgi:hypothetical protein